MTPKVRGILRLSQAVFAHVDTSPYPTRHSSGNQNRLKKKVPGNRNEEAKEKVFGNKSKRARVRTRHAGTYKSEKKVPCCARCITVWEKFSRICRRSWNYGRIISQRNGTIKTNTLILRLFMSASVRAAIHLGQNYTENTSSLQ